jgi:hypothetical protein
MEIQFNNPEYCDYGSERMISKDGIKKINTMIRDFLDAAYGYDKCYVETKNGVLFSVYRIGQILHNWLFDGQQPVSSKEGRFTKRLSKFAHKEFSGFEFPKEFVVKLGNMASMNAGFPIGKDTLYEFVRKVNWNAGTFGDGGSCYWGSNSYAKQMMVIGGIGALLFYNADGTGKGRCWFYQHEDGLIIMNAYGLTTKTIAEFLASRFELAWRDIDLTNNGVQSGTLYLNRDGVMLSAQAELLLSFYDFGIEDDRVKCCRCNVDIDEDDARYCDDTDEVYCEYCYDQTHNWCEICEESHHEGSFSNLSHVCDNCFEEHYATCYRCGNSEHVDNLTFSDLTEEHYCERCFDYEFIYCDNCNEYVCIDEFDHTNQCCPSCAKENE